MDPLSAVTLLLGLLDRAAALGALIAQARSENRDITAAELDSLRLADDTARDALVKAIADAKAAGR